ncbi:hypothetical protein M0R45_006134 [Rubus argutus]|uniref:PQL-like protein n=1 Tax=Rubus argutus TaxID=59490 RepID=A0AAW1YPK3_RUBAR
MAIKSGILQNSLKHFNPTFSCHLKPSFQFREKPLKDFDISIKRRIGAIAALSVVLLAKDSVFIKLANGFDFQFVAPDQTIEEAESGIIGHAQALLQVKDLIETFITIIQQKPGNERPLLRKLYSNLFNNVTRLDYAARDKDASLIRQCYENIVLVLNEVLSRL